MDGERSPLDRVVETARRHAALGDAHRLAMAEELALADRSPAWFGRLWGMASNLVSHHAQVLGDAGLIQRVPSEADRRRVFLRLTAQGRSMVRPPRVAVEQVLFVCTHNSARSQFAEALWRRCSDLPARSGGTSPAPRVHPAAVRVARRHGVDLTNAVPKTVEPRQLPGVLLVTVCDGADRSTQVPHLHWSVPDPVAVGTAAAFSSAWDHIAERVGVLAEAAHPAGVRS